MVKETAVFALALIVEERLSLVAGRLSMILIA
jgi:hypothetical protein